MDRVVSPCTAGNMYCCQGGSKVLNSRAGLWNHSSLTCEFFFPSHPSSINDDYVSKLKSFMSNLHPAPPRTPSTRSSFVSKDLSSTAYVFIRHDAVHKPLQHPYDGPFKVLQHNDKYFTVDVNGR